MEFFKNLFHSNKPHEKELYSLVTNSFNFPKKSEFWQSIACAHNLGIKGEGKKIAVLDIGFDLSNPKLNQQTKLHRAYSESKSPVRHGTTVALLILEVAPQAELYLFDIGKNGKPDSEFLDAAILEIQEIGADIVNLSWGKKIPKKVHSATEMAIEHCNCYVCSKVKPLATKTLVITSVGNDANFQYCPSTVPNVYNVGFQYEKIKIEKTKDGGKYSIADATKPLQYSQSLNTHFTIMQPENLRGSSFAAPLFVGVIALMTDPTKELPKFLSSSEFNARAGMAFSLAEKKGNTLNEFQEIENLYLNALRSNPHGFLCKKEEFCFDCSIFTADGYHNLSLLYINSGQLELAQKLAEHTLYLWPFSAHPYSSLATILRAQAENEIKKATHQLIVINEKLQQAIIYYNEAIDKNPELSEVYKMGQKECYNLLQQLK